MIIIPNETQRFLVWGKFGNSQNITAVIVTASGERKVLDSVRSTRTFAEVTLPGENLPESIFPAVMELTRNGRVLRSVTLEDASKIVDERTMSGRKILSLAELDARYLDPPGTLRVVEVTQAELDALETPDEGTLYIVTEEE